MKKHISISILAGIFLIGGIFGEPPRVLDEIPSRVLFIGNSFTFYNDGIPKHLNLLAASSDSALDIVCDDITSGGATFESHWNSGDPQDKIRTGNYDVVVLQEQSTGTSGSSRESFYKYAQLFHDLIDSVGATTVFFMTWDKDGAPISSISFAYDSIGTAVGGVVVPVGLVWEIAKTELPDINLYDSDNSHPNPYGTYFTTCIFYTSFTQQSPVDLSYISDASISAEDAKSLQEIAFTGVMGNTSTFKVLKNCKSEITPFNLLNKNTLVSLIGRGKLMMYSLNGKCLTRNKLKYIPSGFYVLQTGQVVKNENRKFSVLK